MLVNPVDRLTFSPHVRDLLTSSDNPIVVTGGGGWLGRATLEMLDEAFGDKIDSRVTVYSAVNRELTLRSGREINSRVFTEIQPEENSFLAHYAYLTREKASQMSVDTYIDLNRSITDRISSFITASVPQGMLLISSGAVYLGDDLATNPYGVLKHREEKHFFNLAESLRVGQQSCRTVIPRLFNTAGPFINKIDSYVLATILEDIRRGGPIKLKSPYRVLRSYIHVRDFVDLGFALMLGVGDLSDVPFDTAGEREIEIGELAELARSIVGNESVSIERPPLTSPNEDRYVGDPTIYNKLAASCSIPLTPLSQQIADTALYLSSIT